MVAKEKICSEYHLKEFCVSLYPPRPYQEEAVNKWLSVKYGAIKLPTGAGKTLIALWSWVRLDFPRMIIVVPTNALKQSHINELTEAGIPRELITTTPRSEDGLIAIVTYALLTRYPNLFDEFSKKYKMWVFDEVHHTAAERFFENVFTNVSTSNVYVLGLSATPHSSGTHTKELRTSLPIIYSKTLSQLKQYLAPTQLYLVATPLTPDMEVEYEDVIKKYKKVTQTLLRRYNTLNMAYLSKKMYDDTVKAYFNLYNKKKNILSFVPNKDKAIALILNHYPDEQAMIFSERQNQLIKVIKDLREQYDIPGFPFVNRTVRTKKKEKEVLDAFREGKIRVLGLVKKGEEGVNFPDVSIGIIVSSPKNERTMVQRVGRIIRKNGNKTARIFYLYVPGTDEERIAQKLVKLIEPDEVKWITMDEIKQLPKSELVTDISEPDTRTDLALERLDEMEKAINAMIKENIQEAKKLKEMGKEYEKKYGVVGWSIVSKDLKKTMAKLEWAKRMKEAIVYMQDYLTGELSKTALIKYFARNNITEKDIKVIMLEYSDMIPKPIKLNDISSWAGGNHE